MERNKNSFFRKDGIKETEQLINDKSIKIVKAAWGNSLKYQIPEEKLTDVEIVIKELKEIFNKYL